MSKRLLLLIIIIHGTALAQHLPLNRLSLPPGFHINLYARVPGARSITLGKNNILFVGTRKQGNVYALIPNKTGTQASKVLKIASGLDMPNGVAYYKGDLYVAEVSRILRYPNIEAHLSDPPKPQIVVNDLPDKYWHGWRYIKFSPDGWLYIAIGAPCDVCISKDARFATIMRMRPDGSDQQIYAKGVRNSVGFDWDPKTGAFWFTDNGRDWMGDNLPPDKLNYAPKAGTDFGFPFCHASNLPDPKYGKPGGCKNFHYPTVPLGPHVAALGMVFYTGNQFPTQYRHQIFIAEHGSWNRSKKIGYRVTHVKIENNKAAKQHARQPFITGWLKGEKYWGRPVDLLVMPDGSLLISDDYANAIYRVTYTHS